MCAMKLFLLLLSCYNIWAITAPLDNNSETSNRIIDGFHATIKGYPFLAAINIQTSDGNYFCGGSLLGSQWILTAGQCVDEAVSFVIRLGSARLDTDDPNRLTVSTSTYFLHPDYNPQTLENDVGLIKLRMPITHTDFIKSVPHLTAQDVSLGIDYFALGWGQISDSDSSISNQLFVAHLTPLTNDECKLTYGNQIKDNMLCVAGNYHSGICHGDTGGPLFDLLRTGYYAHVGIASFVSGNGCETTDPSGFTRTYPYVEWIRNITGFEG